MSSGLIALLYAPFIMITLILTSFHVFAYKRTRIWIRNLLFFLSVLIWQIMDVLFFFVQNQKALQIIYNTKTALMCLLHIIFLTLLLSYYGFSRKLPKFVEPVLLCIPVLMVLIALSSPFHELMTDYIVVIRDGPIRKIEYTAGLWIYIELGYSTVILLFSLVALLLYYSQIPKLYKASMLIHVGSCVLLLLGVWLNTLMPEISVNITMFAAPLCALLHYMSAVGTKRDSFLQIDHGEIVDLLDRCILILNQSGMIVSVNQSTRKWFKQVGQSLINVSFKELLIDLEMSGKILRKPVLDGEGEDIYILNGNAPTIYRLERREIVHYEGMLQGTYVAMTDVTRNRILIEQLRDLAGIDALTGLPNRFRYQEILRSMDIEKNYPLSIIMGDVNGLKTVNDTCGHERGDQLLSEIAAVLVKYCPKNGYVARYGGDEFVVLMPVCAHSRAQAYIQTVQAKLREVTGYPITPGIALGSATKNEPHENINALIASADDLMYKNKRR